MPPPSYWFDSGGPTDGPISDEDFELDSAYAKISINYFVTSIIYQRSFLNKVQLF